MAREARKQAGRVNWRLTFAIPIGCSPWAPATSGRPVKKFWNACGWEGRTDGARSQETGRPRQLAADLRHPDRVLTLGAGNVWQAGEKVLERLRVGGPD